MYHEKEDALLSIFCSVRDPTGVRVSTAMFAFGFEFRDAIDSEVGALSRGGIGDTKGVWVEEAALGEGWTSDK